MEEERDRERMERESDKKTGEKTLLLCEGNDEREKYR